MYPASAPGQRQAKEQVPPSAPGQRQAKQQVYASTPGQRQAKEQVYPSTRGQRQELDCRRGETSNWPVKTEVRPVEPCLTIVRQCTRLAAEDALPVVIPFRRIYRRNTWEEA
jgi:hypothetical protein